MRLRQVALVAADLQPVVEDLEAILGIETGFHDPGVAEFGLTNAVLPVGDTFLEVVSPATEGTTAGRYLDRRKGDGGYMVILQSDDLDADRRRFDELGVRVVWKIDLPDIRGTHLHPRDVGGAILSVDDATPPDSWRWGGPDGRQHVRTDVVRRLSGVVIQAADPDATEARWREVLGEDPDALGIRFVPDTDGRGDGVTAIEIEGDAEEVRRRAEARGRLDGHRVTVGGVELLVR